MNNKITLIILICLLAACNKPGQEGLDKVFLDPPESAKPWVYWYWVKAAVSKEGITADLEAMKESGIGGAYLFTVQGADDPSLIEKPVEQLTPEWWEMVRFAFNEAKRLGLKMAMHSCDGFTIAGGPWITPEMSMQKIVWSKINISGSKRYGDTLPLPETTEGYYKDIAVYAYPTPTDAGYNTDEIVPIVTTSIKEADVQYLCNSENTKVFKSEVNCWIQYCFKEPFLCRTIYIKTKGLNYQSHRLFIESSNDGLNFRRICRLNPPRHGWQDYKADITHSLPATKARYFRFVYDKEGSEPGSEDLDAARWNPALKILGIKLSGEAVVDQFEGKNGSIWRISKPSPEGQLPDSVCISMDKMINISQYLDHKGFLNWKVPAGNWTILRIGHTSTGHKNYMGGKGLGLECDKFNPDIVKFQFDQWFGKTYDELGAELASEVLKIFHVDSWECGSQNWSTVFAGEFKKRRGYDLLPYLPIMTGLPLENRKVSEGFLYDVRQTISELIAENFFETMAIQAKKKGCLFSSESVAPVMVSDAMLHYAKVDIPMGEFWFNSPTHDKPTDILDAVSGAHIYGKSIVQAESFTTLRMDWSESPASLKSLGDRNFALGINRLVFHVFVHNPWMNRKPGMTLSGVGLYFQRDLTWWKQGRAWIEYIHRCQAILQQGRPVADIAVFTGEELPRRAFTPDRLTEFLPGLFDNEYLENEKARLANIGVPMQTKPDGVNNSLNTYDPASTPDPFRGYKYDSFNRDALLRLAKINKGRIVLPGGASYSVLVIPGKNRMDPCNYMSAEVADKILELISNGATVIFADVPKGSPGLNRDSGGIDQLKSALSGGFEMTESPEGNFEVKRMGKGRIVKAPYFASSLSPLNIAKDFDVNENNFHAKDIAWTHRRTNDLDIYFISNQKDISRELDISVRVENFIPEIFDPLSGENRRAENWEIKNGKTEISLKFDPYSSLFLVFREKTNLKKSDQGFNGTQLDTLMQMKDKWLVKFDKASGGPNMPLKMNELTDWTSFKNDSIRYYSGTATYTQTFETELSGISQKELYLDLGFVADIAEVWINGKNCGIAWTYPYRVNISGAVRSGKNILQIDVTNTWRNRLIGDQPLSRENRVTWTTAPYRLEGKSLVPSGLMGPVRILTVGYPPKSS